MDITPNPKRRWLGPSFSVRFDDQQEARDVAGYGVLLPFPTIAGLQTLAIATSTTVKYPKTIEYGSRQVGGTGEELAIAVTRPEVLADVSLTRRLVALSGIFRAATEA